MLTFSNIINASEVTYGPNGYNDIYAWGSTVPDEAAARALSLFRGSPVQNMQQALGGASRSDVNFLSKIIFSKKHKLPQLRADFERITGKPASQATFQDILNASAFNTHNPNHLIW